MQKLISLKKEKERTIEAKSRVEKKEFLEVKNVMVKIKTSMTSTSRKVEQRPTSSGHCVRVLGGWGRGGPFTAEGQHLQASCFRFAANIQIRSQPPGRTSRGPRSPTRSLCPVGTRKEVPSEGRKHTVTKGGAGTSGVWDENIHTTVCKTGKQQGLTAECRELCPTLRNNLSWKSP